MPITIGQLRAELSATIAKFQGDLGKAADSVRGLSAQMTTVSKDFRRAGQQMTAIGSSLTKTLTLPITGVAIAATKLGIDFQSSFAGVRKTVDATGPELDAMALAFRKLATEIPVNVNELNRLGEAAGALGIPKASIVDFAKTMALLGVTTNVTSEQAAESIAKIQNIFGAAGVDTEKFASTLVALGNEGASTEAEILELTKRLAGAGKVIGLSQGEVLGFASALANVGIEAESGGTALSKVFVKIAAAVDQGGAALSEFAKVAGLSTSEFAETFEKDAAGAIEQFVRGLGRIEESGGSLFSVLGQLELGQDRVRDALLRIAGSGDNVRKSLDIQADAWEKNEALMKEANERFKTTESRLIVLGNKLKDVGITLFGVLQPGIEAAIAGISQLIPHLNNLVEGFGKLPKSVQVTAIGIAGLAAIAGPLLVILGQLAFAVTSLAAFFAKGGIGAKALIAALHGLRVAFGFLAGLSGGTVLAIAAIGAGLVLLVKHFDSIKGVVEDVATIFGFITSTIFGPFIEGIKELGAKLGGQIRQGLQEMGDLLSKLPFARVIVGVKNFAVEVGKAIKDKIGDLREFAQELRDAAAVQDAITKKLAEGPQSFQKTIAEGANKPPLELAEAMKLLDAQLKESKLAFANSGQGLNEFKQRMQDAQNEVKGMSASLRSELSDALQSPLADIKQLSAETGLSEDALKLFQTQLKNTEKATDDYADALKRLNEATIPLSVTQQAVVRSMLEMGLSQSDITKLFKISDIAVEKYASTLEDTEELTGDLSKALKELAQDLTKANLERMNEGVIENFKIGKAAAEELADARRKALDPLNEELARIDQWTQEQLAAIDTTIPGWERYRDIVLQAAAALQAVAVEGAKPPPKPTLSERLKKDLKGAVEGLNDIFQSAFEGGGNIAGAVQSFATNIGQSLLAAIPVVGQFLAPFAGAIVSGLKKLFGGLFGGPSKEEKEARETFHQWENDIQKVATAQQKAEAAGRKWALTNIIIRDAYIAIGKTGDEALNDIRIALDATHNSAEDVAAATERINENLEAANKIREETEAREGRISSLADDLSGKGLFEEADETAEAIERIGGVSKLTQDEMERVHDVVVRALEKYRQLGIEAPEALLELAAATQGVTKATNELIEKRDGLLKSIENEAPEEVMGILERETREQIKVLDEQIKAAEEAGTAFGDIGKEAEEAAGTVRDAFDKSVKDWFDTHLSGKNTGITGGISDAWASALDGAKSTARGIQDAFNDLDLVLKVRFDIPPLPRFTGLSGGEPGEVPELDQGSHGLRFWGSEGTLVRLHDWEAVVPADEFGSTRQSMQAPQLVIERGAIQITGPVLATDEYVEGLGGRILVGIERQFMPQLERLMRQLPAKA